LALAEHVFKCLNDCGIGENKLVSQTYYGAAILAGEFNGLQPRVGQKYSDDFFVLCCAHRLSLVLSQAIGNSEECKIFFKTLNGFSAFFPRSPKRSRALDKEVKRRLPKVVPTSWNSNSRIV
jgi:hypothetical protein